MFLTFCAIGSSLSPVLCSNAFCTLTSCSSCCVCLEVNVFCASSNFAVNSSTASSVFSLSSLFILVILSFVFFIASAFALFVCSPFLISSLNPPRGCRLLFVLLLLYCPLV